MARAYTTISVDYESVEFHSLSSSGPMRSTVSVQIEVGWVPPGSTVEEVEKAILAAAREAIEKACQVVS